MRIGVVVGNPNPQSRTLAVAERLATKIDASADVFIVDLVDYSQRLFVWPDDELDRLSSDIAACDLLIVASPTYKATYTGLLKAFLDRYPSRGLAGVFAIPLMTLASDAHRIAPDVHLRPLLVELGAVVPTSAVAFLTDLIDQADTILEEWVATNERSLALVRMAVETSNSAGDLASPPKPVDVTMPVQLDEYIWKF